MLTPYRRVLAVPGALAFSATGVVARLPISMVSLGIVLLVAARSGSYQLAGAVAAAYLVGNAGFAVVQGRLADRLGQSRVLPWTILVFTTSMILLMWAVEAGWRSPVPHAFAVLAGMSLPQIGSCIRARWSHVVPDKRELQTAFALEAVADEAVFMLGPVLVTVLATALHPLAGLGTAVAAGLLGTLVLAAQRSTEPPAHPRHRGTGPREPMGWRVLGPLVVSGAMLGVLFGGSEVATVALAEELGAKAAAGPVLAVFALGSLLAGVVSGTVHWQSSNASRFRFFMVALAFAVLPLPFVDSMLLLGVVLFVAGFGVSPTLIATVAWIEETVPPRRLTEGISIITTGMYVGLAPGAAVVGVVIDRHGASAGFWVPVAAAALGAVVALGTALVRSPQPSRVSPR
ncbi:MAG TPA: MFS transporter [Nocardioidaceae bacterium]